LERLISGLSVAHRRRPTAAAGHAGRSGGAVVDYPRTSALDARVNPRIKSGDGMTQPKAQPISGRRQIARIEKAAVRLQIARIGQTMIVAHAMIMEVALL
jgi:hypothetical protein